MPAHAMDSRTPRGAVAGPSRAMRVGNPGATALLGMLLVVGSLAYALVYPVDPETGHGLAVMLASLVVLGALVAAYRNTRDILNPMSLAMVYFGLLFPFHGAMMVNAPLIVNFHGAERHEWFGHALLVAAWAAWFMHLGFMSSAAARLGRSLPSVPFDIDDTSSQRGHVLFILFGLSLVAKAGLVVSGLAFHFQHQADNVNEFMGFQFILVTASGLSAFTMLVMLGRGLRERSALWLALGAALFLGEIAWGLFSGSRLTTLMPIVHTGILLHRVWRPLHLRHVVVVVFVFVFVLFPFLTAYRTSYNERLDEISREGAQSAFVADAVGGLFDNEDDRFASEQDSALETLAGRMHGLASLSLIMRYTPERSPFLYGVPYAMLPLQILVPRAIWNDKPDVAAFGRDFKTKYWGLRPEERTSVAVSQLGDLWVNLHLFGALFGSFLMGVLFRFLADELCLGGVRGSIFHHTVYSLMLVPAVAGLSAMGDAFLAGNVKTLFVLALIGWFFRRRRARQVPR